MRLSLVLVDAELLLDALEGNALRFWQDEAHEQEVHNYYRVLSRSMAGSTRVAADGLVVRTVAEIVVDGQVDAIVDRLDRAVAEDHVEPAGMGAAEEATAA